MHRDAAEVAARRKMAEAEAARELAAALREAARRGEAAAVAEELAAQAIILPQLKHTNCYHVSHAPCLLP